MQEKLAITVLVITLALFALVMILYNLMTNKKEDYNQIVLSQQEYDSRVIPFRRGDVMDRNGTYLATSEKVYNLILDPKQIMSDQDAYLEPSVMALIDCFGYDRTEILNLIQEKKDKQYIRYAKQLTYSDKENYETYKTKKAKELKNENKAIKGIWFEDEYKRVYPYNSLASSVIGFASSDGGEGTGGVEQSYNSTLMGTNGREYGYLNDDSNLERVIKPATNGNTVVSTIDLNIQKIVEKYIREWEQQTGSEKVGVIVMNPNNGEVLAMADDNTFDLNHPRDLSPEYTDERIRQLGIEEAIADYKRKNKDAEPLTEENVSNHYSDTEIRSFGTMVAWNQTWRNFTISDGYEPGSTSKIFTISAALEEGAITGNESYDCPGFLEVGGYKIRCASRYGHGLLTVEQGLMKSCNVVMMRVAQQMGKDKFYKYQKIFGFGTKTGIDLPGEADNKTLMYSADSAGPTDLATNSFGQNFNCTMIQMAAAYSSVINGGSYYEPHVVKQILNEQGSVVKKMEPVLVRETVSESTSKFINEALFKTVNAKGGTGGAARVEGYKIAGKTGTAEKIPRDKTNYLVSFCGYAPSDNPQVLVYVVVDQPHVESQPHSTYASEIFKKIMTDILPYLNIFPDTDSASGTPTDKSDLPVEEGITSETKEDAEQMESGEESKADGSSSPSPTMEDGASIPEEYLNPTDEFIDRQEGDDSNLPDSLPKDVNSSQNSTETDQDQE
ncbi:penicillin-binding protein 2 [Clostridium sp. E02]|uniref:peptidoglycan D,D-transpeptidase FtsI family protein n=1 Tax=Clostridium sp. E02 TaxID=2487134 RepID=UPI000F544628|nr:penicillin-binding protein 2 [Clostridium sp. E02]